MRRCGTQLSYIQPAVRLCSRITAEGCQVGSTVKIGLCGQRRHKWNDYVDKQADLGRSGARDCDAPEWQDESIPTDADDGESSTVGDDVVINGGGTTIPLDDIGDGASSYADDPPDSPENRPPPSAPPSQPKAPVVEHGVIWISYTPSAQARHIGDNKGIRRERAIDIDVDPADSTDVDVITSAATAFSLDNTVENRLPAILFSEHLECGH